LKGKEEKKEKQEAAAAGVAQEKVISSFQFQFLQVDINVRAR